VRDGFVYLAIGSDVQWRRLTALPRFAPLANEVRATNEGRHAERDAIHRELAAITARSSADQVLAELRTATIPATRILDIRQVRELPALAGRLTRTRLPDGRAVRLPPMAVEVPGAGTEWALAPRYGEHTDAVLAEAGVAKEEILSLRGEGIVA
jgi:crotonobetainyl-CoA:carnitine CoA-transferase CaiB-like acyl-CoA transferase